MKPLDIIVNFFTCVTTVVFIVAFFLILKEKNAHKTVWFLWAVGFAYSISDILLLLLVVERPIN